MAMSHSELANHILLTLNIVDFLQFVDQKYEDQDKIARALVDSYFLNRYTKKTSEMEAVLPFMQLKTTLTLLPVPLAFALRIQDKEWQAAGFAISPNPGLHFFRSDQLISDPTVHDVICVMRNACAHLPDCIDNPDGWTNVSFDCGCVSFSSKMKNRRSIQTRELSLEAKTDFCRSSVAIFPL